MLTRDPATALAALLVSTALLLGPARVPVPPPAQTPVSLDAACARAQQQRLGDDVDVDVLGCEEAAGAADTASGRGRAVVAVGDLDTAQRLVVLVPGSDTDLGSLTPAPGQGRPGGTPLDWARTVAAGAPERTCVVLWVGYETPVGLGAAAATGSRARAAAPALVAEVAALRHRAAGGTGTTPRTVVVGHSYGAVVVALAARDLPVDDLVLLGSPGARVRTAAGLGTHARVWAARADDDWVRRVPHLRFGDLGHGTDPASEAFGARTLPTGGVRGHDGYLQPGASTLGAVEALLRWAAEPQQPHLGG